MIQIQLLRIYYISKTYFICSFSRKAMNQMKFSTSFPVKCWIHWLAWIWSEFYLFDWSKHILIENDLFFIFISIGFISHGLLDIQLQLIIANPSGWIIQGKIDCASISFVVPDSSLRSNLNPFNFFTFDCILLVFGFISPIFFLISLYGSTLASVLFEFDKCPSESLLPFHLQIAESLFLACLWLLFRWHPLVDTLDYQRGPTAMMLKL